MSLILLQPRLLNKLWGLKEKVLWYYHGKDWFAGQKKEQQEEKGHLFLTPLATSVGCPLKMYDAPIESYFHIINMPIDKAIIATISKRRWRVRSPCLRIQPWPFVQVIAWKQNRTKPKKLNPCTTYSQIRFGGRGWIFWIKQH